MKAKILTALQKQGYQVLYIKGIFVFSNGRRLSRREAMKLAGIKAKPRQKAVKQLLYGDYAWIAAINGIKQ